VLSCLQCGGNLVKNLKILSIKDATLLVKLMIKNFGIQIPEEIIPTVERDIAEYALQIYSEQIKEDSLTKCDG
jgi:hypothetical protein